MKYSIYGSGSSVSVRYDLKGSSPNICSIEERRERKKAAYHHSLFVVFAYQIYALLLSDGFVANPCDLSD